MSGSWLLLFCIWPLVLLRVLKRGDRFLFVKFCCCCCCSLLYRMMPDSGIIIFFDVLVFGDIGFLLLLGLLEA